MLSDILSQTQIRMMSATDSITLTGLSFLQRATEIVFGNIIYKKKKQPFIKQAMFS